VIKISEDNLLTSVIVGSTALSALFSLSGGLFFSRSVGLGIAAGSAIAIINFVWQRSIMRRALGMQQGRPTIYTSVRYLLRLGITAILLYYILTSDLFSLTGLLVGLSVVVIMVVICTLIFAIQNKGD
jgi:ATP/ADP translocase